MVYFINDFLKSAPTSAIRDLETDTLKKIVYCFLLFIYLLVSVKLKISSSKLQHSATKFMKILPTESRKVYSIFLLSNQVNLGQQNYIYLA